ncbi:hypothetical protein CERSUDRAFT_88229 [Gelatoporia subvermispora B]|uniref:Uncharacterized protein n=1 Tax=Ceriporiopsis subvermispora (strain B) TaxID=914234 RepID=M2Q5Y9_CERS8|nr:hypothetical protein CERSUDRAFT_88229 [Gelatoporia subvermispora B]
MTEYVSRFILPRRKKALIIGIVYAQNADESEISGELLGPHKDARDFEKLLIDVYGYDKENVVVMLDHSDTDDALIPTKSNIIMQIQKLVDGAQDGHHFALFFSGHSMALSTHGSVDREARTGLMTATSSTLDGNLSHRLITDVLLRKILVQRIPRGARLMAIFDCCHSGTILGLRHYNCNAIPHFETERECDYGKPQCYPTRRKALPIRGTVFINPTERVYPEDLISQIKRKVSTPRRSRTAPATYWPNVPWYQSSDTVVDAQDWCSSPTTSVAEDQCDGNCRGKDCSHVDIPQICQLSACEDTQMTFESPDGECSFAHSLVGSLTNEPHPSIWKLMCQLRSAKHHIV